MNKSAGAWTFAASMAVAASGHAQVIFADSFDSGASPLWSNSRGAWTTTNGEWYALAPANDPTTCTLLPFEMGDCSIEVDVLGRRDGGIWLHADSTQSNAVLLVTGGFNGTGRGLYWHVVSNGGFSTPLGVTGALVIPGEDHHLTVVARGARYFAYIDGVFASSLDLNEPRTGMVGLYDFAAIDQRFDNFVLRGPCPGDFNVDGGVDGTDVDAFFVAWESGLSNADINNDGGVDGADVEAFFAFWENGC